MYALLCVLHPSLSPIFFFTDTATTAIYTLSLHDALPISTPRTGGAYFNTNTKNFAPRLGIAWDPTGSGKTSRSEEHTSELQSLRHLVCRLLLEKKKQVQSMDNYID